MIDCVFCKIIAGELEGEFVYQDDEIVAFHDINPQAPVHVLIVPRKHISSLNDVDPKDVPLIGKMAVVAQKIAKDFGVAETGYRLVWNTGENAGQWVYHVHMHLLGGRRMTWPPG